MRCKTDGAWRVPAPLEGSINSLARPVVVTVLLASLLLPSVEGADLTGVEFGLGVFDQLAHLELTGPQQAEMKRLRAEYEPSMARLQQRAALTPQQRDARSAAVRTAIARGLRGTAARDFIETAGRPTDDQNAAERQFAERQLKLFEAVRALLTPQQRAQLAKRPASEAGAGDLVVRLSPRLRQHSDDAKTLNVVADELQLTELSRLLTALDITATEPLVPAITRAEVDDPKAPANVARLKKRLRSYWLVHAPKHADRLAPVIEQFNRLPEVDFAYKAFRFRDPSVDPSDDPYCVFQCYLDPAPRGIDARYVWKRTGGAGASTGLADVERGWYPHHQDFASKQPLLIHGDMRPDSQPHGTAVLGEVIADDNQVGIVGIAPSADFVFLSSYFDDATMADGSVPAAIYVALCLLNAGDVLLVEVEEDVTLLPAEVDDAVFDVIELSTMLGVTVVAAGGNGGHNLDAYRDSRGKHILNRGSADFRDSGAIMVGGADFGVPHERADWSNYGSRIDCYAWGRRVVSTGFKGDLDDGNGDVNKSYTIAFNGTSSAAPIIAGAAMLVQGLAKGNAGRTLPPSEIRAILANPDTGTPQGPKVSGAIGVMPDLRAILECHKALAPAAAAPARSLRK